MIARGFKFREYEDSWMNELYLDGDVLLGYWLLAGYREHAHKDASGEYPFIFSLSRRD